MNCRCNLKKYCWSRSTLPQNMLHRLYTSEATKSPMWVWESGRPYQIVEKKLVFLTSYLKILELEFLRLTDCSSEWTHFHASVLHEHKWNRGLQFYRIWSTSNYCRWVWWLCIFSTVDRRTYIRQDNLSLEAFATDFKKKVETQSKKNDKVILVKHLEGKVSPAWETIILVLRPLVPWDSETSKWESCIR